MATAAPVQKKSPETTQAAAEFSLRAARTRLCQELPFMARIAFEVILAEEPRCGTCGVSEGYTLFYSPEFVCTLTVDQLAGVLAHELWHLLDECHDRARVQGVGPRDASTWNIAADASVNGRSKYIRSKKIPGIVLPENLPAPENMTQEEYYHLLRTRQQQQQAQQQQQGQQQQAQEEGEGEGEGRGEGEGEGEGSGSAAGAEAGAQPSASQQAPAGSADQSAGDDSTPRSAGSAGGGEGKSGGRAANGATEGDAADQSAASTNPTPSPSSQAQDPGDGSSLPGGSGSDGIRRAWETAAQVQRGPSPARRRQIQREVAAAIKAQGSGAGNAERGWADRVLCERPLPWQKILAGEIRAAVAWASGQGDYSWTRISRRSRGSEWLRPAIRRPIVRVAVVIDTSGSMGDRQIGQAVHEVDALLRATQCEVTLISCDDCAYVAGSGKITSVAQIKLVGGGGTDMGKGVHAALKIRPRPPICITITDGETDWPSNPPPVRHVCVLVGSGHGPAWGKTVQVGKK